LLACCRGGRRLRFRETRRCARTFHCIKGAKPQITAATLANNAAENNKKLQANQNVRKSWYHLGW
jgi:hypothetical protein